MLEIIRPPENIKVPIAEEGLTEEFQPIEEMGRLRSWRIQSAPLTKEEYISLKNELEKPGFLRVTGTFLHPNKDKVLYLKVKSEIVSLNEERDDIHYSIEFRLKDAEGLYGGAQDVSPTYSTIVYTFKDNTGAPISGVDIEIYNIKETTDENGVARFNNFYKLREFNFATGEWEYNEEGLVFKVFGIENELIEWEDSLYIDEELIEVSINLSINEFTILDTNNNPVENVEIEIDDKIYLTTDTNGQTSFYTHSNETLNYNIIAPSESNIWDINKTLTAHNTHATSTYYDRTMNYEKIEEEAISLNYGFGLEYEIMYYAIEMTVLDYDTGLPVENAEVTIKTNDDIDIAQTKSSSTNADGVALVEEIMLESETAKYKISHPDYDFDMTGYITVPSGVGLDPKVLETTKHISIDEPFVLNYIGNAVEEMPISYTFGLEYAELTYSVDFTIYEFNNGASDYKGSLAEGAELTYTDHYGNVHTATSVSGLATLEGFRGDTSYQVDITHNGETTNLLFDYSESTAETNNWELVEEAILIKDDRKREPTEQIPVSYNFDLAYENLDSAYEGGFFVDFSETNILDDWTSRYVDEFETWSIIDDAGATGGKLLKHDTSQNIRRLFSFDPLWQLWNDDQFGKRVWEDMEIVSKVKATVDTGNQNRLHVRSGYNIGNMYPTDTCAPNLTLAALIYKDQLDINFTVKDDVDSALLESADITLELDYGEIKSQITDLNGEASFIDEDSGTLNYNYEVTRPGYEPATGSFTVDQETAVHNEEVLMTAI